MHILLNKWDEHSPHESGYPPPGWNPWIMQYHTETLLLHMYIASIHHNTAHRELYVFQNEMNVFMSSLL